MVLLNWADFYGGVDSGAYCAAVIITLLKLPLDLTPESPAYREDGSVNLLTGVADYVRRCEYPTTSRRQA
jgi:hypothetical protein